MAFQPSLFGAAPGGVGDGAATAFDAAFARLERRALDDAGAWVDVLPGWVEGSDALFATLREALPWAQRSRTMYEQRVIEPRLTAHWSLATANIPGASAVAALPPIVEAMRQALSARYGVAFDSVGFNLYRDGQDSVAWHRDRIDPSIVDPVVALVSLGAPRRFLMRPRGERLGQRSRVFELGAGDLLVTGGTAQRTWDHAIPKVTRAVGARISLAFRHGLDPRAYVHKRVESDQDDRR